MAVAASLLTSNYDNTDASSYATASVTPGANRLLLLGIANARSAATAPEPTATGNGLTWVTVVTQLHSNNTRRVTVLRAMGASPSTGAITIDFAADTQVGCAWILHEYTGMDTSGTNGSGAIVQSVGEHNAAATSATIDLASAPSASNGTSGFLAIWGANEDITPGTGFTEYGDVNGLTPTLSFAGEFKDTGDQTVDFSWTTSSQSTGCAIEIKVAGATAVRARGPIRFVRRGRLFVPARNPSTVGV